VTDSTLDSLTEKAPYPFCHPKSRSPFSLRRFDEAPFNRNSNPRFSLGRWYPADGIGSTPFFANLFQR